MKTLLILGAGIYQLPLIRKAKEMGLHTIVSSRPGDYPGVRAADDSWPIDTRDYDQLLKKSKGLGLAGVCTTGTDVSVISVAQLCSHFSLVGLPIEGAARATNKLYMKQAFESAGVSTPRFKKVQNEEEAASAFPEHGGPVVIKAVDSSGSRGINRADTPEEARRAFQQAMEVSNQNYALIEEYIDAHEIGVDGLICGGKILLLLPHDKFTCTVGSTTLPEGHRFPYRCDRSVQKNIETEIRKAVKALKLDNCAFNADVLIQGDKVYILEMGGRAGATCIPELISIYTGLDYYECLIKMALGESVSTDISQPLHPCMAKLLFSKKTGKITKIDQREINRLEKEHHVFISLDYSEGTYVEAVRIGPSRIGQVILQNDDLDQMNLVMSAVRSAIEIDGVDLKTIWEK